MLKIKLHPEETGRFREFCDGLKKFIEQGKQPEEEIKNQAMIDDLFRTTREDIFVLMGTEFNEENAPFVYSSALEASFDRSLEKIKKIRLPYRLTNKNSWYLRSDAGKHREKLNIPPEKAFTVVGHSFPAKHIMALDLSHRSLSVSPEFRGRGIASLLFATLNRVYGVLKEDCAQACSLQKFLTLHDYSPREIRAGRQTIRIHPSKIADICSALTVNYPERNFDDRNPLLHETKYFHPKAPFLVRFEHAPEENQRRISTSPIAQELADFIRDANTSAEHFESARKNIDFFEKLKAHFETD